MPKSLLDILPKLAVYFPPEFSTSFAAWNYSTPVGEKKATVDARGFGGKECIHGNYCGLP
jgi:hypothetical protein